MNGFLRVAFQTHKCNTKRQNKIMKQIFREDIVNKRIVGLYESKRETNGKFSWSHPYVELDDGIVIELLPNDSDEGSPIYPIDLNKKKINKVSYPPHITNCINKDIVEVVDSDYWFSYGLLLSNMEILYYDIDLHDYYFYLVPINQIVEKDEIFTYWGRGSIGGGSGSGGSGSGRIGVKP
jgi:hypothetical protein